MPLCRIIRQQYANRQSASRPRSHRHRLTDGVKVVRLVFFSQFYSCRHVFRHSHQTNVLSGLLPVTVRNTRLRDHILHHQIKNHSQRSSSVANLVLFVDFLQAVRCNWAAWIVRIAGFCHYFWGGISQLRLGPSENSRAWCWINEAGCGAVVDSPLRSTEHVCWKQCII